MDIDDLWGTYGQPVTDWLLDYGSPLLFGAGAVGATLAAVLVWRFLSRGETHAKLGAAAVALATLFAMEGMYEVAHGPLNLNVAGSLIFCATFEIVMLHQGTLAAHKLAANPAADVTRHMRFVWLVAGASGLIASTASDSVTEVVLRLATPPLAAGIWYMSLYADKAPAEREESQWIWTPQRIGVRLGLLKPGTVDDLGEVFRRRKAAALVDATMALQAARDSDKEGKRIAAASARLQRLAKDADQDTMAVARDQLRIVRNAEAVLTGRADEVSGSDRALLDEVRLTMRAATDRLRADHRRAFGPDQPMPALLDQPRTNGVDQLRTSPVDQKRTTIVDQPRTSQADQTTTPTEPVDRPVTSKPVAAERTSRTRKTTARIDVDSSVPNRVAEMAAKLAKRYRGDIPSRRTVMQEMGWTSAGDAGQAIRLVREKRSNTP